MISSEKVVLQDGLDLREVINKGSILQINELYCEESNEDEKVEAKNIDFIGHPIKSFSDLEKTMEARDKHGHVKKRIIEEGGGMPLHEGCTVSISYSGYWEHDTEPFDVRSINKPLVVDLKDSGLLPGMQMAVESMLVGEMSVFLLSYQVMYGELGIPPRIKPKANCVFYIKLVRSILTPKQGPINFADENIFNRVHNEARMLYASGSQLYKTKNYTAAIQLFRKAVYMLHKCRLADEEEEKKQEKTLIKLYINLAICYNHVKQPLRACIACNELRRLTNIWNNAKILFQNAKALRMIGAYDSARKRLLRAMDLRPNSEEMEAEMQLLEKTEESCNQTKLVMKEVAGENEHLVHQKFKDEVDDLIRNFKSNPDLCKLTLPGGLGAAEIDYIKEVCIRENVFCNRIQKVFALDKDSEQAPTDALSKELEELSLDTKPFLD